MARLTGTTAGLALQRYRIQAAPKIPMPDVMVLIPGITGSVLRRDGRDVWALSSEGVLGALRTLGANLAALQLRHDSADADDLGDGVIADRLFDDVHFIPFLWRIDGYSRIRNRLLKEYDVKAGENYFEFPYDWRRDNRVAARQLQRKSRDWLNAWREKSGKRDAKLILLAHSMGGLVSRYFLECLDGWRVTRKLFTFGTPYGGSLNALNFLANGKTIRLANVEVASLSELLRSFTSVYQLLPRYPCYDAGNGELLRVGEAKGIPNVDTQRASDALAFYNTVDAAIKEHLRDEAYTRDRYQTHPLIGIYQPTFQSARLIDGKVTLLTTHPKEKNLDGDGTVPSISAKPLEIEAPNAPAFVAQVHGSLQNTEYLLDQISGLIRTGRVDESLFRELNVKLAITVQDIYSDTESISMVGRCDDPGENVSVLIRNTQSGEVAARETVKVSAEEEFSVSLKPLKAGSYRVTVSHPNATSIVDLFLVAGKGDL